MTRRRLWGVLRWVGLEREDVGVPGNGADCPQDALRGDVEKGVREFTYTHGATYSLCMTGVTLVLFVAVLVAGAAVEGAHLGLGVLGASACFVGGYVAVRKGGRRLPERPAHAPFLECRMTVVLMVLAAAVWKVPVLLEAAPAILSVACCFGGGVDGMFVGALAGRRGLSFAGAFRVVWREGFDHRWPAPFGGRCPCPKGRGSRRP